MQSLFQSLDAYSLNLADFLLREAEDFLKDNRFFCIGTDFVQSAVQFLDLEFFIRAGIACHQVREILGIGRDCFLTFASKFQIPAGSDGENPREKGVAIPKLPETRICNLDSVLEQVLGVFVPAGQAEAEFPKALPDWIEGLQKYFLFVFHQQFQCLNRDSLSVRANTDRKVDKFI